MEYVKNRWIKENTIEYREYQEKIARIATHANTLVVLPTALGKTIIALLVATNLLDRDMNKKILFLAPTRPLVEQHKKTFERFLKLGLNLVSVTGKIKPEKRKELYSFGDIIFSTPQCIKNDIAGSRLSLENFSLLIVDEAQHCVGNYAYTYVTKKFIEHTKGKGRILALTASPGSSIDKISEIKSNLFVDRVEIKTERDKDVSEYVKPVRIHWIRVELTPEIREIREKLLSLKEGLIDELRTSGMSFNSKMSKIDLINLQKELSNFDSSVKFAYMKRISQLIKIDHMLELIETQTVNAFKEYLSKLEEEAVLKPRGAIAALLKSSALNEIKQLLPRIAIHPKIEAIREIVKRELQQGGKIMIFAQLRSTVKEIERHLSEIEGCKPLVLLGQRGREGMKQQKQIEVTRKFDSGECNVLITTSIGEEGLHLGSATTAIFYEPVPSEIRSIQRRGRVGREMPGKVYILMSKGTRDEGYYWASFHKERRMKSLLKRMKKEKSITEFVGREN